jgi:hypothetical protein
LRFKEKLKRKYALYSVYMFRTYGYIDKRSIKKS